MLEVGGSKRTSLVLYLLITVLVMALFVSDHAILGRIELGVQDSMFRFRGERPVSGDVVICALDDASLDRIGWPGSIIIITSDRNRAACFLTPI